jgi:predicted metal-dependent phosphoesterase TrpH
MSDFLTNDYKAFQVICRKVKDHDPATGAPEKVEYIYDGKPLDPAVFRELLDGGYLRREWVQERFILSDKGIAAVHARNRQREIAQLEAELAALKGEVE